MAFTNPVTSLTLPTGAGVGDPRIVVGSDIPTELTTLSGGRSVLAAVIWYVDATTYMWYGVVNDPLLGGGVIMRGTYSPINGIKITDRYTVLSNDWRVGETDAFGFSQYNLSVDGAGLHIGSTTGAIGSPFTIDGRSAGRGLVSAAPIDDVGSLATTVEAVYLTVPQTSFQPGRAFELRYSTHVTGSALPMGCAIRSRRTNVAGIAVGDSVHRMVNVGGFHHAAGLHKVRNNSSNTIVRDFILTLCPVNQPVGATVNSTCASNRIGTFEIWDVGDAADYPGWPAV